MRVEWGTFTGGSGMSEEAIRFEDFELDRGAFELRREGRAVRLERIPLELLFFIGGASRPARWP
jgi:hypothetical protein